VENSVQQKTWNRVLQYKYSSVFRHTIQLKLIFFLPTIVY